MEITLLVVLLAVINVGGFYVVLRRIRDNTPADREKDELRDQLLAFKDIGASIQKLAQQQEEAQTLSRSLKDLLQAPKLRGTYGEVILEEMFSPSINRSASSSLLNLNSVWLKIRSNSDE